MSRYVDIDALTQEVLASVEEETRAKTASDSEPDLKTEIGKAIKQAAVNIRDYDDTGVTSEDLRVVVEGAKQASIMSGLGKGVGGLGGAVGGALAGGAAGAAGGSLLGGPLGTVVGGVGGAALGAWGGGNAGSALGGNVGQLASNALTPGAVQPAGQQQQQPMQRTASALGDELRKLAAQIRDSGSRNEEIRLTKAAQMLTAAVGLEHLTEGLK